MFSGLVAYLDSIRARDPAPRSRWEVLLYPGVLAVGLHRIAHWLFEAELWWLARFVNHLSRFLTAIDIHPGAEIGRFLFVDHGFVVIGETSVIGDNVTIYQGATLGGTNPTNGERGKRHPTLDDDVIVSLGAAILGPLHVGRGARIGANAVVTKDVAPGAVMIGIPARPMPVNASDKQRFTPYGTPCSESIDQAAQRLDAMRTELEALRAQLACLADARAAATTAAASTTATERARDSA